MGNQTNLSPSAEMASTHPVDMLTQMVDSCTQACHCGLDSEKANSKMSTRKRVAKVVTLYATMVVVSTLAIYFLEHATVVNAVRTALVAAIGKTFAANWVSSLFN